MKNSITLFGFCITVSKPEVWHVVMVQEVGNPAKTRYAQFKSYWKAQRLALLMLKQVTHDTVHSHVVSIHRYADAVETGSVAFGSSVELKVRVKKINFR